MPAMVCGVPERAIGCAIWKLHTSSRMQMAAAEWRAEEELKIEAEIERRAS